MTGACVGGAEDRKRRTTEITILQFSQHTCRAKLTDHFRRSYAFECSSCSLQELTQGKWREKMWFRGHGLEEIVDVVVQRGVGAEHNNWNGSHEVCDGKNMKGRRASM